jgi:2-C-methyl-D-erythritol 4-phosphate cytidylyltransferase
MSSFHYALQFADVTPRFAVILAAGGQSSRFARGNKLLAPLAGLPVIAHAFRAFRAHPEVHSIVVAAPDGTEFFRQASAELASMLADDRVKICAGGRTRAQSVGDALALLPRDIEWVAVHDAARPLVSRELIDRTMAAALAHGAAAPALAVQLTIKEAEGPLPAPVIRTLPRSSLWAMQTPQIMRRQALNDALQNCPLPLEQVTDDAQLLELAGHEVWLVEGEARNIKITTAEDLLLAEAILQRSAVSAPR